MNFSKRKSAWPRHALPSSVPTDLQLTLKGLDATRAALVVGLVADFVNSRFDFTDEELVREHFWLDP